MSVNLCLLVGIALFRTGQSMGSNSEQHLDELGPSIKAVYRLLKNVPPETEVSATVRSAVQKLVSPASLIKLSSDGELAGRLKSSLGEPSDGTDKPLWVTVGLFFAARDALLKRPQIVLRFASIEPDRKNSKPSAVDLPHANEPYFGDLVGISWPWWISKGRLHLSSFRVVHILGTEPPPNIQSYVEERAFTRGHLRPKKFKR
jgi:hypothetical protein